MARPKRLVHCEECGRNRLHLGRGLCQQCYFRQYCAEHREEKREYDHRYYAEHREHKKKCSRQWREANKERERELSRRWYAAHYEEEREHLRMRRKANPEYQGQWQKANPDKVREISRRYRAHKRNATIGPIDEAAIYKRDKVCIYCGADEDLTIDHLTPLARGGSHTQDNLAVACRRCNSAKGTKTYEEFSVQAAGLEQPRV